jgi:glycosyltransferase involved in cell wall biosynthesis
MPRILMVGPVPPPYGGIASAVEEIVNSGLAATCHFDIFSRTVWSPMVTQDPFIRNIHRIDRFLRFFRLLLTGHYDLVHLHSAELAFPGTVVFMLLARLAGQRVLLHLHGTEWNDFYRNAPKRRRFLIRWGLRIPQRIAVLYAAWAENIKELAPAADVWVVRNRIRRRTIPNEALVEALKSRLGLGKEHHVVVAVGSVGWRKGSFDILKAVPQVTKYADYVRFVLVGGEEKPGELRRLRNLVETDGLSRWVVLTGEVGREQTSAYYAIADIFLLPSYSEGLPIAILEAMQLGKPVISTRVGAIPEILDEGISGLFVSPGAPDQIAAAVSRLLQDPAVRRKMGEAAQAAFDERFDLDRWLGDLKALYEMT